MNWECNFAEVKDGQITIIHHSTSSIIEIISDHPDNISKTSLFLEYYEFDSLIKCISKLMPYEQNPS